MREFTDQEKVRREKAEKIRELGIDPKTGERIKKATGKNRFNKKTGEWVPIKQEITKMESVKDAYDLISDKKYNKE